MSEIKKVVLAYSGGLDTSVIIPWLKEHYDNCEVIAVCGNVGLVSFSCAMQVQTFRKVNGYAFASTMCIGNMRSGMEALSAYIRTHDRNVLGKALRYWEIIFLFAVGAGIGGQFVVLFGAHTIWFSCLLLLVSFCLMFIREEMKEHPEISVEEETIQKDLWDIEKQIKNIGHQVGEDISVMKSPHNKDSQ